MFQAEIGSEAFLIEILAHTEGFSGTGMTYMHRVPVHLIIGIVIVRTEVGIEAFVVAVGQSHQIGDRVSIHLKCRV